MAIVKGYNMKLAKRLKDEGKTAEQAKSGASNREMSHVVIKKNGNRYMAIGEDAKTEDKMSVIMSEANAMAAIESGHAKKSTIDWD
jgi:hypothetical protein